VVIAAPDQIHAFAALTAMKMKKHVYCEKPLAHSMSEIKAMVAGERKYKVTTQTGNQGHSSLVSCKMSLKRQVDSHAR
jgi:predicted dehydrogenase